jgi:uncharacterized protein (DUF433 family)
MEMKLNKLEQTRFILGLMQLGKDYRDALCQYPWITPEMFTNAINFSIKLVDCHIKLMEDE